MKGFGSGSFRGRSLVPHLLGVAVAAAYGVTARYLFGAYLTDVLGVFSIGFFVVTPFVLGVLTVLLAPLEARGSFGYGFLAPWVSCTLSITIVGALVWEVAFCVVLAFPFFLALASLGGVAGVLLWRVFLRDRGAPLTALMVVALLPYISAGIERAVPVQDDIRRVHSSLDIKAPPAAVWREITNLAPIGPAEQQPALFQRLGLPRPIEARMACEAVGCVRRGQWEHGLAFDGVITSIEPGVRYWVELRVDTRAVQPSSVPLDQVGGRNFDMVDDGYEIEPLPDGGSRLHLSSTYRLRTGINAYAGFWVDLLLRDIQGYILRVEQARAEATR